MNGFFCVIRFSPIFWRTDIIKTAIANCLRELSVTSEMKKGTYQIKVKARDIPSFEESEWSEPLPVSMPKNKPYTDRPFLQFLQNFLQNHPLIYQLLQRFLRL